MRTLGLAWLAAGAIGCLSAAPPSFACSGPFRSVPAAEGPPPGFAQELAPASLPAEDAADRGPEGEAVRFLGRLFAVSGEHGAGLPFERSFRLADPQGGAARLDVLRFTSEDDYIALTATDAAGRSWRFHLYAVNRGSHGPPNWYTGGWSGGIVERSDARIVLCARVTQPLSLDDVPAAAELVIETGPAPGQLRLQFSERGWLKRWGPWESWLLLPPIASPRLRRSPILETVPGDAPAP